MPLQRFLIAPLDSGLQRDVRPWMMLDNAFQTLRNAYVYRGRIKKRFGARIMNGSKVGVDRQLFSRLRIDVGTTAAVTGNFPAFVVPGTLFKIGQMFSIGTTVFTVFQNGVMYTTGTATGTYNTATGSVIITGNNENPLTKVYFYPADPVMHLGTFKIGNVNDETLFAFDTQFAYTYSAPLGWQRSVAGSALWVGTNSDFHWSVNYRGTNADDFVMFVTNNVAADQFHYWNGTTSLWTKTNFAFKAAAGNTIETSKIIISYKDRLLLLNTTEIAGAAAAKVFPNRMRFSVNGSPFSAAAWYEQPGSGGYLDAPTKEAIISAAIIRDRLIVFFERSTFELIWTNNKVLPFRWETLDTELGVESMNSIVLFDRSLLGIGPNGIHACNGVNVQRIDTKIPDEVFGIQNKENGPDRVTAIQDYKVEAAYWSYTSSESSVTGSFIFPNRVLVYNYTNDSWAYNDDCITAFGHYYLQNDISWASLNRQWQEYNDQWNDPSLEETFRAVIAGNQEGFTFIVDPFQSTNARSLQITNITIVDPIITLTIINHNLPADSFIHLDDITGDNTITNLNDANYKIEIIDNDTVTITKAGIAGTYTGAGNVRRVSKIEIKTKVYNFFLKDGQNIHVPLIEFYVDATANGQITVDWATATSRKFVLNDALANQSLLGSNILSTVPYALSSLEKTQQQLWHQFYCQAEGESIQLLLEMTDEQMIDTAIADSDFQLHAIMFWAQQTGEFGF